MATFTEFAPPALDSAEYATAVDEVMRLGGFQNSQRTAEQTEISLFWADDYGGIHFNFDDTAGRSLGQQLGTTVLSRILQPKT